MARKKTTGKFAEGQAVRVRPGVMSPEFPEVSLAGWTGTVVEGGKSFVVEWDAATLGRMPAAYRDRCEQQGLYYPMVSLGEDDLEAA